MTITDLIIEFSDPVYYAGQMLNGEVLIKFDAPTLVAGVELLIKGRAKFNFNKPEYLTESDEEQDEESRRTKVKSNSKKKGKELYLLTDLRLEGEGEFTNDLRYPFNVALPPYAPSTFAGKYGGIGYYAKVKVLGPFGAIKIVKKFFKFENRLDLNRFQVLKNPVKQEISKTFCCLCCTSGPLTVAAYLPKTGFGKTEIIPILVEADNASNVEVEKLKAFLYRKTHWKAQGSSKDEMDEIEDMPFGPVPEGASKSCRANMTLPSGSFANIEPCQIITVEYTLKFVASLDRLGSDLEFDIPITFGDIPFHDEENGDASSSIVSSLSDTHLSDPDSN